MKNLLIFILFAFIGLGIVGIIVIYPKTASQTNSKQEAKLSFLPQNQFSIINAPSETIRGRIATLSGEVKWQDRVATQASEIVNPQAVQQGEELSTGDNGNLEVEISTAVKLKVLPKSRISFIQTLPQNVVLSQNQGKIEYQKTGFIPISVRIDKLLLQIEKGEITVSIDETKPVTTIKVLTGLITLAYNDSQNVSNVKQLKEGKQFIFNNTTRQGIVN